MPTERLGKARGARGSFYATVSERGMEDVSLPCAPNCWFTRFDFHDPLMGRERLDKVKAWLDAIQNLQRVILSQVIVTSPAGSEYKTFYTVGYVGVYTISNLVIDDPHVRFVRAERPFLRLE